MRIHGRNKAWRAAFPMAAMMAAGRGWDGRFSWDHDGSSRSGTGRGPRGRRRIFGSGELRLVLLKLIADEPRHGYELIKAIGELTGETYEPSPGAVYPTLSLLSDEGAIKESPSGRDDDARKAFQVTGSGQTELETRKDEVDALLERLSAMSGHEERNRAPELFRAMGNLAGVLKHKYRSGGFAEKDLEEIVDIIDDAAKRIERL
ncbi:MAG: PadR family transcriptional regulator [Pontixanthobacter sp.]